MGGRLVTGQSLGNVGGGAFFLLGTACFDFRATLTALLFVVVLFLALAFLVGTIFGLRYHKLRCCIFAMLFGLAVGIRANFVFALAATCKFSTNVHTGSSPTYSTTEDYGPPKGVLG